MVVAVGGMGVLGYWVYEKIMADSALVAESTIGLTAPNDSTATTTTDTAHESVATPGAQQPVAGPNQTAPAESSGPTKEYVPRAEEIGVTEPNDDPELPPSNATIFTPDNCTGNIVVYVSNTNGADD